MADVPKVFQRLDIDPYATIETELIGMGVVDLEPQQQRNYQAIRGYGDAIGRAARTVLLWWTPARTESEALKRAADSPTPSVIAKEVALFTALFEQYAEWANAISMSGSEPAREALRFQADLLRGTIQALERRAQAAEARAMDYRIRYEFDKLRQVVAGREIGSKIADLIEEASKSTASVEHMRALVEKVRPTIERMERDLALVRTDVDYTAARVMEESVQRMLPGERLKSAAGFLSDVVGSGSFLSEVIRAFGRLLG